jgi:hypothetical protein
MITPARLIPRFIKVDELDGRSPVEAGGGYFCGNSPTQPFGLDHVAGCIVNANHGIR